MSQRAATFSPTTKVEPGFAAVLREHTKAVHRAAERAGFLADLLHGRATLPGYALFLRNLQPVYQALEAALSTHHGEGIVGAFADLGLRRCAALSRDLAAIDATDGTIRWLPEAVGYAAAVAASAADPARLLAHAYARYLGDLSGGQILAPLLARTLGLAPHALTFYDFPDIDDIVVVKARLRDTLEAIPVGSPAADIVCDEALLAFRHNIAISEAVQAALTSR